MTAGREKVAIFEYNAEGMYVRKFKSMSECRRCYFSHTKGKIRILRFKKSNIEYGITPEGNFLFKERLGKAKVRLIKRIHTSPYCTDFITKNYKIVQVFNLKGELLLEARNLNILAKLTTII